MNKQYIQNFWKMREVFLLKPLFPHTLEQQRRKLFNNMMDANWKFLQCSKNMK